MIPDTLIVCAVGWLLVGVALAIAARYDALHRAVSNKIVYGFWAACAVLFVCRVAAAVLFGDTAGFVFLKKPVSPAATVFYMVLFQAISYALFCILLRFLYTHQKYIKLGGGDVKILACLAVCLPLHHMLCVFGGTFLAAFALLIAAALTSGDFTEDGVLRDLAIERRNNRSPYLLFLFISFTIYVLIMTLDKLGVWGISWRFW